MLYCIDTQTFVWGVKKQAEPHDAHKLEQARVFMQWIDKSKHQLVVPTIVLAESLIREPEETHSDILSIAHRRFIVADFDSRAAMKYGELLRLDNWQSAKDVAKENGIRREKMKLDHTIIACALVHGANGIFSDDDDVIKFAKGIIPVHSISSIPKQMEIQG